MPTSIIGHQVIGEAQVRILLDVDGKQEWREVPLLKNCKAFDKETLLHLKPEDLSGGAFRGCGGSFETPEQRVFPEGTMDVYFIGCRLDNVTLPPGSVLDADCSNYQYRAQADGKDYAGEITLDAKLARVFVAKAVVGSVAALPYKTGAVKVAVAVESEAVK